MDSSFSSTISIDSQLETLIVARYVVQQLVAFAIRKTSNSTLYVCVSFISNPSLASPRSFLSIFSILHSHSDALIPRKYLRFSPFCRVLHTGARFRIFRCILLRKCQATLAMAIKTNGVNCIKANIRIGTHIKVAFYIFKQHKPFYGLCLVLNIIIRTLFVSVYTLCLQFQTDEQLKMAKN